MPDDKREEDLLLEVQKAYEKREIKPYFQPLYDAVSRKIVGAEALARWIKEDGSFVMPGEYIPILERTDAIWELDWYMLKEVCIALREQMEKGIPCVKISVNFSRKHIDDKDFATKLCSIVDSYEISHSMIQIEITESALVNNKSGEIEAFANAIRNAGFKVAIDDFGCGLSSLSTVKDVSVDTLKIDRSLMSRNCQDEKEKIVLESILEFAHRLKLTTVAEGVETEEQLGFLRTCGCHQIQGFLFAKPMPKEEFWQHCVSETENEVKDDILDIQSQATAIGLLLEAVYTRYPLIIYINLTRDSFYMMKHEDISNKSGAMSGSYDESICGASHTMHPDDKEKFVNTFGLEGMMKAYHNGKKAVSLTVRQLGDDNVYHKMEITNYFVKNPSVDDVLVISMSRNLE